MKHKLLAALTIAFSFVLGACSLGGNTVTSAKPWGNSSAPVFGSSSQESTTTSSEVKTTCTVTFYVDKKVYATQEVKKGYQANRPEDPYKAGYVFKRWEDSNGTRWEFGVDCVWKDLDLYAVFEKEGESSGDPYAYYTVNFYVEGNLYYSQTVAAGSILGRPGDPYLSGYTFLGWKLESGDWWDFSKAVYSSMNLYAAFAEADRHHIITLYGDFTEWALSNDYERKSGNGFPMVWEGIYLPASTVFGFHVLYDDGEEYDIGWSELITNGCPYVKVATGNLLIRTTNDVTLDFTVDETHQITITSWTKGPSSSISSSSGEVPSSSATSSEDTKEISTLSMHLYDANGSPYQVYPISPTASSGELGSWKGYDIPENYSLFFQVNYKNGDTLYLTYKEIDPKREWLANYTDNGALGIKVFYPGKYDFVLKDDLCVYIEGYEPKGASSGSSSSSGSLESSSVTSAQITLSIYRSLDAKTDTYVRYESEGYPIVWEGIDVIHGDFFYIDIELSGVGNRYGWESLDPASASSGVFYQTTGGIGVMAGGTFSFTLTSDQKIYVTGWESAFSSQSDYSSEYYPSSESTYSSESSQSSSSISSPTIILTVNRENWTKQDTYVRYESEGYPIVWEDIDFASGDEFYITLNPPGSPTYPFGWANLDDASATSGCFAKTSVGIQAMIGGTYSITFTATHEIVITGWSGEASSESSESTSSSYEYSSSDSYYPSESTYSSSYPSSGESTYSSDTSSMTSEEALEDGWYLVGSMTSWMSYLDYRSVSSDASTLAIWENVSLSEGDLFLLGYVTDLQIDWDNAKRWNSVGDKSTPYFAEGDGDSNIVCMQSGIYNIYLSNEYLIYFVAVEPLSSESTYSSDSYQTSVTSEEALEDGWYLVSDKTNWEAKVGYLGVASTGTTATWNGITLNEGDLFCFVYLKSGVLEWDHLLSWPAVFDQDGTSFRPVAENNHNIVCHAPGIYDIYIGTDSKIYFAYQGSSSSISSSESTTSEASLVADGRCILSSFNG